VRWNGRVMVTKCRGAEIAMLRGSPWGLLVLLPRRLCECVCEKERKTDALYLTQVCVHLCPTRQVQGQVDEHSQRPQSNLDLS
jgi:hypothetical protein